MSLTFHCSNVSIVDFETANAGWVNSEYLKSNILLRDFFRLFSVKDIIGMRSFRILSTSKSNNIIDALYCNAKTSGIALEFTVIPQFSVLPIERLR